MTIHAIFFDFGGTLVSVFRDAYPAYAVVLGERGIEISRQRWIEVTRRVEPHLEPLRYSLAGANPSWGDRVSSETLRELGIPDPDGQLVAALHEAFTAPERHRPFPESQDVIRGLREDGVGVHVVSNNTDYLPEEISRLRWTCLFDSVTYSQEVGAEKPDRRVFDLALRRAGCKPADVMHIGDSWEADYLGAKRAGLRAIWLNRDRVDPPEPCEMIHDLREVPRLRGS